MSGLIYGHDAAVAEWVAKAMNDPAFERGFGNCTAIGIEEGGRLIGGTVFHNLNPESGVIEMSSAARSPRWLAPKMLRAIFAYPFDQLGCQMVVLRVSERNTRMVRIAERFGFNGYLIPRLRGRGEAEYIFTLTDDQWRQHPFARSTHGQALSA